MKDELEAEYIANKEQVDIGAAQYYKKNYILTFFEIKFYCGFSKIVPGPPNLGAFTTWHFAF